MGLSFAIRQNTNKMVYVVIMGEIEDRVLKRVKNVKPLGIVCSKCGSDEITEISYGTPAWLCSGILNL